MNAPPADLIIRTMIQEVHFATFYTECMARRKRSADHAGRRGRDIGSSPAVLRDAGGLADSVHPYSGRIAVLSTKHGKLPLIGPPLERAVGVRVEAVVVDTDSLGTFTGDVARVGSPLDTAIAKARLGMRSACQGLGIASEGSIAPDPAMPFVVADRELVVFVDDDQGVVVWESHSSCDIVTARTIARPGDDLDPFLVRADFPAHRLIVRPNSGPMSPIVKGIANVGELTVAVAECAAVADDGQACIESDLRAHACPSRRAVIAAAAGRLAARLAARCPLCGAPGWGRVGVIRGLPCAWCGTEVARPRAEIDGCVACDYRATRPIVSTDARADPGECQVCNP